MRIDLSDNSRAVVAAFMRSPQVMASEVDLGLKRGALEVGRTERQAAPKAFGTLAQSVIDRRVASMHHQVTAGVNYALAVERGSGPGGSPSQQTLEDWIRVKGIAPRTPGTTTRALAFLIGRKIRRRGTPAQPFAEPTLREKQPRVLQLVRQSLERGVRKVGGL